MPDPRRGALYGAGAYVLWGLFPLYWPLLEPAKPVEILAHRFVWSLVVVVGIAAARRELARSRALLADRRSLLVLGAAACFISVNWGVYIYGVNSHQVVETSLGYFMNPIVTVLLGVLLLGERLRRAQWAAVALAAVAVSVLTADYGRPPWIAMTLAASFGTYGLLKKRAAAGAVESLTVETAVLTPPAVVLLVVLQLTGSGTFGHGRPGHTALLVGAGVVTAVPLLFFGAAATRIPLTTLGLLQYITPTMQFLLGVLLRHEPLPPVRLVGFALVWAALAVFSADGLRHRRRTVRGAAAVVEPPAEAAPVAGPG